MLDIDISFSREGRAGSRVIRMRTSLESSVSTVSSVGDDGTSKFSRRKRSSWLAASPAGAAAEDDADGADAKTSFRFGHLG